MTVDNASGHRITAEEVARLASLGIRVTDHKDYDLPQPDFIMRSDVYLYAQFGVAGVVYPYVAREGSQSWYVHPVDMKLIQPYVDDIFGQKYDKADYYWTMPFYLSVFEGIAAWLARDGVPRDRVGDIWALHCMVALAEKRAKRITPNILNLKTTADVVAWLAEHDIAPSLFYRLFYRSGSADPLAEALAELQFVAAHPGLHPALLESLFA